MKTKILYIAILSLFVMSCSTTQTGNQTMKKFDRNIQPKSGPVPTINLGKPQSFTLENGLKVLVVENHKLPRVSASLSIDNKPLFEGEKAGMSQLLSALLGSGTINISKDDFNEKVDFLGARVSFGSNSARMSSLSKFFPEIFDLMTDAVLNPIFTQEEFDKEIAQAIDGIKSGEKSVSNIASRVESVLAYGKNHPYGEFTTIEHLKSLTLQDVKDLYNTYFKPNNAYLVIVGDVNFNEVKNLVKKNLNTWKKGTLPEYTMPSVNNVEKTEIDFIDMPNASQSQVTVLSTIKLKMSDPDYHAVLVANQIFGGDFNSYLNMNLRETNGFTYGARSSLRPDKYISEFKSGAQVRNEVVDSTVVEIFKELTKIRNEQVTPENLKNIKAGYAGKFVMAVEKPRTVARYALNIEKYDLATDFYETYLKKINAVTIEDVQRVAQKYFNKDKARIVVTSKGVDVIPSLEKLGYTIKYFDKEGNPTNKPKMLKEVPNNITTQSVLDNYIKAIGGKEKLESLNSIEEVFETNMNGMPMLHTNIKIKPNLYKKEVNVMGQMVFKMVFNGLEGYMEQMGSRIPMPEDLLNNLKSKKGLFEELYLHTEENKLSFDGIIPVNGKEAYIMHININGEITRKYYEVKSKLLVKKEETKEGPDGKVMMIPTFYSNYKEVGGILFPHTISTKAMGEDIEMILKSVELNKKFTKETFK